MQTRSGKAFYPAAPDPASICIEDIAFALSNTTRFGGHTDFYSVAEHSVLVSQLVPTEYALQGLLHDATEAYLGDIPAPLKALPEMAGYRTLEQQMWRTIAAKFGLPVDMHPSVHEADRAVLLAEKRVLIKDSPMSWDIPGTPADVLIMGFDPYWARQQFMRRFEILTKRKTA